MSNDFEAADRFNASRALAAPFLGLLVLVVQQGILFTWQWGDDSFFQIAIWLIFSSIMLALLITGGGWFLPKRARELANDEITKSNRQAAIQTGFLVAMITGFLVWAISPFEPLHAQRAANIIVSMSLGTSFVAFGMAELRTNA